MDTTDKAAHGQMKDDAVICARQIGDVTHVAGMDATRTAVTERTAHGPLDGMRRDMQGQTVLPKMVKMNAPSR